MAIVTASGVGVRVAKTWIIQDVTLSVERGDVWMLLGANGAGKSTLIKVLLDILRPDAGTVHRTVQRVGYVPQKALAGHPLTVLEMMQYFAALKRCSRNEMLRALEQTGLQDHLQVPVMRLSGGYRQRLSLAQALLGDPELLVLDEPFVGLDEDALASITAILDRFLHNGGTLLYTTHMLGQPFSVEAKVALMEKGRLVRTGLYRELLHAVRLSVFLTRKLGQREALSLVGDHGSWMDHGDWIEMVCRKEDLLTILNRFEEQRLLLDWFEEPLWRVSEPPERCENPTTCNENPARKESVC
ncbi:ABC transporter ATP-binding protein [Alicyclobacillus sp.]|uniref:ABC transporter ATP-binding protein n=1 Tax=Alicyclobacillus sp. TaxID=61169 RepID=UPI0025BDA184|nr:ABC transporter ATP-binding protein [Alicyclobacillus sp.]MCL6517036.1 ABC transporter ATP-binding protein [Alicyclobacillus sp.]